MSKDSLVLTSTVVVLSDSLKSCERSKMLSRALLRAFRPQAPRALPRTLPKSSPRVLRQSAPITFRRFESDWGRFKPPPPPRRRPDKIIHTRWDPEFARNAKPLFTDEQLGSAARHANTKWIFGLVVAGGVIFYFSNLEEVPISGMSIARMASTVELDSTVLVVISTSRPLSSLRSIHALLLNDN